MLSFAKTLGFRDSHLVLRLDEFDNVGGVCAQRAREAALDVGLQPVVDAELLLGHREDDVDRVLLDLCEECQACQTVSETLYFQRTLWLICETEG